MNTKQNAPELKIGELAKRLDLNVKTLRYYEEIGLLPPPRRTESGYRVYSEDDERLLRFVMQAKQVGLTLEEVREVVQRSRAGGACDYVREMAVRHIGLLNARIAELQRLRADLHGVLTAAEAPDDTACGAFCRLIERRVHPSSTTKTNEEIDMADSKRKVEVFTAGCPLCDETVKLVQSLACSNCEVTVYDLREGCATNECRTKAKEYGVHRVPAVVIDGKLAECCQVGPVSADALRAAGLGAG